MSRGSVLIHTPDNCFYLYTNTVCTCWRKVVRTGSKHMPTERSSQTAGRARREKEKKRRISNIDRRKVCTNRKHTDDKHWKRKYAFTDDSIKGAHPIFLRLNIEIVTDPGQRMDCFGQHWTVQTHTCERLLPLSCLIMGLKGRGLLPFTFPPVTTQSISRK